MNTQSLFEQVSEVAKPKRWTLHFKTNTGLHLKISRDSLPHLLNCMEPDDRIVTITKNFISTRS